MREFCELFAGGKSCGNQSPLLLLSLGHFLWPPAPNPHRGLRASKVFLAHKERKESKVLRARLGHKDRREKQGHRVRKG